MPRRSRYVHRLAHVSRHLSYVPRAGRRRQQLRSGPARAHAPDRQSRVHESVGRGLQRPSRRDAALEPRPERQQVLRGALVVLESAQRRRAAAGTAQAVAGEVVTALRAVVALTLLAAVAAPVGAAEPLKVCADPNNLPFSNRAEQGFENKLARIWARESGAEVEYTWFPQRRGFERNTLNAEDAERGGYKCDVIIGVPAGYDLALTTRPYYRSTYALVYVEGPELPVASAEALKNLPSAARASLSIGVFTPGPAAEWLARYGLYDQMVPYSALDGDPDSYPGKIIENELLSGELDAAILFGPIAGYFAARAAPHKVA